jgi:hypothetical protein
MEFDSRTFPIEPLLRQAVSSDADRARDAWNLLGTMARNDRSEAGIFLLGLMRVHADDLMRMATLVRAVSFFPSEAAADALKAEFHRVQSSPGTRTYLNEVLRALTQLPEPLSRKALAALADDKTLSVKWRRRFKEAAWRLDG